MRTILIASFILALSNIAIADEQKIERMTADKMESFTNQKINWKDEPILPKGAKSALLIGDPTKSGVFIVRLKFPPIIQFPHIHTHLQR